MRPSGYHVFTRAGDARPEIEALLAELGAASPAEAGLHKAIHVARADQTVVMTLDADSAIARALRARSGWSEPER